MTPKYPSLQIQTDVPWSNSARRIDNVKVVYQDGTEIYLIRDRYDISRQYEKSNPGVGSNTKIPRILYDKVRFIHTWTGHCDVETQSTADVWGSLNIRGLQSAVFFGNEGIEFSIPSDDIGGSGNIQTAYETPPEIPYKAENGVYSTIQNSWLIKNISIVDNIDNTSRVTFTLFAWSDFYDVATLYDNIGG